MTVAKAHAEPATPRSSTARCSSARCCSSSSRTTKSATADRTSVAVHSSPVRHRELGEGDTRRAGGRRRPVAEQRHLRLLRLPQRRLVQHLGRVRQPHLELVRVRRLRVHPEPRHLGRGETLRQRVGDHARRARRTTAAGAAPAPVPAAPRGPPDTAGRAGRRTGGATAAPRRPAPPGPDEHRAGQAAEGLVEGHVHAVRRARRSPPAGGRSAARTPTAARRRSAPPRPARAPRPPPRPARPRSAGRTRRPAAAVPASACRTARRDRGPPRRSAAAARVVGWTVRSPLTHRQRPALVDLRMGQRMQRRRSHCRCAPPSSAARPAGPSCRSGRTPRPGTRAASATRRSSFATTPSP